MDLRSKMMIQQTSRLLRAFALISGIAVLAMLPAVQSEAAVGPVVDIADLGEYIVDLHDVAEVYVDRETKLTFEEMLPKADILFSGGSGQYNFGFTTSAAWYRFTLKNSDNHNHYVLLQFVSPWLDQISLYSRSGTGGYSEVVRGDLLPFDQRGMNYNLFVEKLTVQPGEQQDWYIRIQTEDPSMFPFQLLSENTFWHNSQNRSYYFGVLYGALLIVLFYNLLVLVTVRDPRYAWYCLYLISYFAMNFSYNGFSFKYLWPHSPIWANTAYCTFVYLYHITGLLFAMSFLNSKRTLPTMHKILVGFLTIDVLLMLGTLFFGSRLTFNMTSIFMVFLYSPLVAFAGIAAWSYGYRAARYFILASFATLAGSFVTALTVSGYIKYSFAGFHATEFGLLIDMVLLSLALADRILIEQQIRSQIKEIDYEQRAMDNMALWESEALEEKQSWLSRVLESALHPVLILDEQGNIRSLNPATEEVFNYARRELIGRSLSVLVESVAWHSLSRTENDFSIAELIDHPAELKGRKRDGQKIQISLLLKEFRFEDRLRYAALIEDKSATGAIQTMKDEFVSMVSHELRTPLTSIRASLGALASGMIGSIDSEASQLVEIADRNVERLARLVNDILDLQKMEAGMMDFRFAGENLVPLVGQAIENNRQLVEKEKLVFKLAGEIPVVELMADADRVQQLFSNLISNAVKFSPTGGSITLSAKRDESGFVQFMVADEGPGVPESFMEHMFDPFIQEDSSKTRKTEGTGLGLAICRQIVEAHGGRIWCEKVQPTGAALCFTIPVC